MIQHMVIMLVARAADFACLTMNPVLRGLPLWATGCLGAFLIGRCSNNLGER
jgi:hypothetical protein